MNRDMREISICDLRAECSRILDQVRKTRTPIRVTRFGEPLADIVPPSPRKRTRDRLGCMVGTGRIVGDIVGPVGTKDDWEAGR